MSKRERTDSGAAKASPNRPLTVDAAPTAPDLAAEIRRRRELLGWSQVRLARESGVGRTAVNEIEAGRRVPSVRTYAKLRDALGLSAPTAALVPPPPPRAANEQLLRSTCAALLAVHRLPLADLASALDVSIPAVREVVACVSDRLAQVGYTATEDGLDESIAGGSNTQMSSVL